MSVLAHEQDTVIWGKGAEHEDPGQDCGGGAGDGTAGGLGSHVSRVLGALTSQSVGFGCPEQGEGGSVTWAGAAPDEEPVWVEEGVWAWLMRRMAMSQHWDRCWEPSVRQPRATKGWEGLGV